LVRLGHPFPSLLNAGATFAIATLAGGPASVAARLALSMLGIQVAIGALNDGVDAPRDAVAKRGKPIPAGLATRQQALALALVAGIAGLTLSAWSGLPTTLVAALGLALGVAYDLRLSRTSWSWLPLALALPLVPVHAWLGTAGSLPAGLLPLVPTGVFAGAALALANGLVDLERDAQTNRPAVVVTLGARRAWWLHLGLLVVVAVLAVFVAPGVAPGATPGGGGGVGQSDGALGPGAATSIAALHRLRGWAVALGVVALGGGAAVLRLGRPSIRERGWELEALGVAVIGLGWLAGVAAVELTG
jgi:4-hydroxybenzoate polyprenyltransferase